ncbi:glutathione S-transferase family protein [Aspergillus lucknowensis]|uniref:Glutathione transferase n=1 Tax=Aspergillus lucknowensis TaxID=176173 RepID=A0ABR4LPS4_9EURO
MDELGLRSPGPLRPLQPLLASVAENASNLAAGEKHQQHPSEEHPQHLDVDIEARSLQPLQTAVAEFDHYDLHQHHHTPEVRPLRQEDPYGALIDQTPSLHVQHSQDQNESIFSSKEHGYLRDVASILDPPDLEAWRERLFHVDETIVMSEAQFRTYFPHIDNIYSHRSTQRYKRKPLVSHYWDCRLKGRPPGTPKSDDPNKKKRKRTARERDLCDVKIKITEYFPGYAAGAVPGAEADHLPISFSPGANGNGVDTPLSSADSLPGVNTLLQFPASAAGDPVSMGDSRENQHFGVLTPNPPLPDGHPGANGQRFFTIQRVNGNGANGKSDGVSGGHRHTLEESDRVKKNSVQRFTLKEARERKKSLSNRTMSTNTSAPKKYHTKATGSAAETVANHTKETDLKLYGSCFCPFVQRVWIALELKGIPYQYIEVDPYQKPQSLLEVNPRGLVPALRHGNWASYESSVLLEYLEDLNIDPPLLPPGDAKMRAHCRLWTDFINRNVVPSFYRVLQEQNQQKQIANAQELRDHLNTLIGAADPEGPFFLGPNISFVDIQAAPWVVRLSRVLKPYRGWPDPEPGSRWATWVDAIEGNEEVKRTTSTDDLYLDSYERYAANNHPENRPNTSQLANAINSGRSLP